MARWHVEAIYRADGGACRTIVHEIEELEELQDLIEEGPDWRAIDRIVITYTGLLDKLTEERLKDEPVVQTTEAR